MALGFSSGLLTGLQTFGQGGGAIPADPRQRDLMQAAGVTNPLLQQFGKSLGGLFGVETRSPAAIQQAQDEQAKAKTQGLILSQIEASTALTPSQKETYASMIRSGDISEQQVLDVIRQAEETKASQSQVSAIKTQLLDQGFSEEQLANLTPAQIRDYAKSMIDQQRSQAQTMEGAAAYMETLNLDPEIKEQAAEVVASDNWPKLTPAQRTEFFKRQVEETQRKKDISNITKMVASMPEGESKQDAQVALQDLNDGLVSASAVRDLVRAKKDPTITETNTVVSVGNGRLAKVVNKKVGNETLKVYFDSDTKKYEPVTAEMLQSSVKKTESGWPSATTMKFVETVATTSSVIADYITGDVNSSFFDYYTSAAEEEGMLDRRIELSTKAEEFKKEGMTQAEVKAELIKYINSKTQPQAGNADILSQADAILQGQN